MPHSPLDVVVAGHICLDVIPSFIPQGKAEFSDLFRPGKLTQIGRVVMSSGGPVSNTGIALLILGMNVELVGKVGDDFFARGLLDILANRGLDRSMTQVGGEQTSYTIVLAPQGMDRVFLHCPGANNTYGADDVNYEVVARARVFHLGYPPLMKRLYQYEGVELVEIYKRIKTYYPQVCTSLDMSLPDPASESGKVNWRNVLAKVLPYVDLFLPSAEETMFMLERDRFLDMRDEAHAKKCEILELFTAEDMHRLGDQLLALGAKAFLIKSGYRGMVFRSAPKNAVAKIPQLKPEMVNSWAGRELWRASYHVDPVASATGSGDSSIAGFLAAFLRGCMIEEALDVANAVGGCNVMAMDAISGIRSWGETQKLIDEGWRNNPLKVEGQGWKNIRPKSLWSGPADDQS